MSSDNNTLVRLAQKGDAEAFGELYARIALDLYRFALYQTGNPVRAEDAVSDAVLAAFQNVGQLKKAQAFRSWMFSILCNTCRAQQKEKALSLRRLPLESQENSLAAPPPEEDALDLHAALRRLADDERELLLLTYVGGYNSTQLGELLHCKAGTVRARLLRTREKLQKMLSTEVLPDERTEGSNG